MSNSKNIVEGIEYGDLARLVQPVLHIDEFRSKMGEDKDIVVVGITVFDKAPAQDLVNFVEKSYDWVLDGDVSSGETTDGKYFMFVELERNEQAAKRIMAMVTDMLNLTEQSIDEWSFTYYQEPEKHPLTFKNLSYKIIASPEEYESKMDEHLKEGYQLDAWRTAAGIFIKPKNIKDDALLNIQRQAGIK